MLSKHQSIRLQFLPTEILYKIVEYLHSQEIKPLLYINRRMRDVCLLTLFRKVRFGFSDNGFDGLEGLLQSSHLYPYIVSFQYVVPQLLKPSKSLSVRTLIAKANLEPEIRDYTTFKAYILTPDSYIKECESQDNLEDLEDKDDLEYTGRYHPSYTLVYRTLRRIYVEQRHIIETGRDSVLISLAFQRFTKLSKLSLEFCETLGEEDQVESYLTLDIIIQEKSYEHYIQLVSAAMKSIKDRNISVHSIQLAGLSLIYDNPQRTRDIYLLITLLTELLEYASSLQLLQSDLVLEILSHSKLNIHQLELCSSHVAYGSLESFLRTNAKLI